MKTVFAANSQMGTVRRNNEDAWYADESGNLYIVCDGMGGLSHGELASRLAVKTVVAEMRRGGWLDSHDMAPRVVASTLVEAIQKAHEQLIAESKALGLEKPMGTTIVVVMLVQDCAVVVNVGDSRVYHVTPRRHRLLTRDHTMAQALAEAGVIAHSRTDEHPYRHVLLHCLGVPGRCRPDVRLIELVPGERLLLCTDGLTSVVAEDEIVAMVRARDDLDRSVRELVERALQAGSRDNVTAMLIEPCSGAPRDTSREPSSYDTDSTDRGNMVAGAGYDCSWQHPLSF